MNGIKAYIISHPDVLWVAFVWLLPLALALVVKKNVSNIGQDTSLLSFSLWGNATYNQLRTDQFEGFTAIASFLIFGGLVLLYVWVLNLAPKESEILGMPAIAQAKKLAPSILLSMLSIGLVAAVML